MTLPTPTKKDIEAAERLASENAREIIDLSTKTNDPNLLAIINAVFAKSEQSFCAGYSAGKMEERALALKLVEAMFDEVAHEIADFFGRPCTDSVVYEKIIAIKEKRIRDYKQATGIGDDKDKVFISCEQKRSTEIL